MSVGGMYSTLFSNTITATHLDIDEHYTALTQTDRREKEQATYNVGQQKAEFGYLKGI